MQAAGATPLMHAVIGLANCSHPPDAHKYVAMVDMLLAGGLVDLNAVDKVFLPTTYLHWG